MKNDKKVLEIENLRIEFKVRQGIASVLHGLDLFLRRGETLGIVGESGCGKSITALAVMQLIPMPPGKITSGKVFLNQENLLLASERRMREVRGKEISMIFQEPMTSLNPVYTVGFQIAETVRVHEGVRPDVAMDRALEMLRAVEIPDPKRRLKQYPFQLSGGMRQRVMIAMALACNPKVLIADEPTTALDVTVQAQIFDLIRSIQEKTGTSVLFITHNMAAIAEMADRVAVMYAGRKVEEGSARTILLEPQHPYTRGLISSVPHLMIPPPSERPELSEIPGIVPSALKHFEGCPFSPRCKTSQKRCLEEMPPSFDLGQDHKVACWDLN